MIKLRVEHHKVFIEEASSGDLASLRKLLKIYNPVFHPAPGAPPFEILNLYYKEDKSFPTGYLNYIISKGQKQGLEIKIKDNRRYPGPSLKFKATQEEDLWENQAEALAEIKQNVLGTVSSATGSGKTRLIEETINYRSVKTLVIVPYRLIQNQVANKLIKVFGKKAVSTKAPKQKDAVSVDKIEYQKIGGGYQDLYNTPQDQPLTHGKKLGSSYIMEVDESKPKTKLGSSYGEEFYKNSDSPEESFLKKKGHNLDKYANLKNKNKLNKPLKNKIKKPKIKLGADITVLCFSSLPEVSEDFLQSIECVIIDECHHSSAITIREALDKMNKAAYRYGFSATPWRDKSADQKLLLAALGDKIIYDLSGEEAVARGIIAQPKYHVITSPTPDQWLQDDRNWRQIVEKGIIGNASRNKAIVNKAIELKENDHNVFICVDEIAHVDILKKRFEELGHEVLIIHGEQHPKINQANIKKIGSATKGLISIGTMAVGEGTDMPNISAIILASGGKASIRFLQRIGRGTRLTNGKDEVIIVDFEDWFNPTLLKHFRERRRIFKKYFGS